MVHTAHTLGNGGAQEAQRLHWAENERVKLGKQHTPFAYFPSDILEINISYIATLAPVVINKLQIDFCLGGLDSLFINGKSN